MVLKGATWIVVVVDEILRLDEERRALIMDVETKKQERNVASKEIGRMKDAAEAAKHALRLRGFWVMPLQKTITGLRAVISELNDILYRVPNIPDPDVPMEWTIRTTWFCRPLVKNPFTILKSTSLGPGACFGYS